MEEVVDNVMSPNPILQEVNVIVENSTIESGDEREGSFSENHINERNLENSYIFMSKSSSYFLYNDKSFQYLGSPCPNFTSSHLNKLTSTLWRKFDDKKLLDLVKTYSDEYNNIDWSSITTITGRYSSINCISRYDQLMNNPESFWDDEKDLQLNQLVQRYGRNNWLKISDELSKGKISAIQCLKRYQKNYISSNSDKNKTWSETEELILKLAYKKFGNNWLLIQDYLPFKTSEQIMNHWRTSTNVRDELIGGSWLIEEERLLFLLCLSYNAPTLKSTQIKSEQEFTDFIESSGQSKFLIFI